MPAYQRASLSSILFFTIHQQYTICRVPNIYLLSTRNYTANNDELCLCVRLLLTIVLSFSFSIYLKHTFYIHCTYNHIFTHPLLLSFINPSTIISSFTYLFIIHLSTTYHLPTIYWHCTANYHYVSLSLLKFLFSP